MRCRQAGTKTSIMARCVFPVPLGPPFLYVTFPTSGVKTWVFLPPLVAIVVSFFTSMGGVSGAFLLLPFQVSGLGYTSPSVSGTNQAFNVVAIPSGVYRYIKEGRTVWPLTWAVIIGTLPGVFIGAWVRVAYLPDPRNFKLFAGLVLLYIGMRLAWDALKGKSGGALAKKGAGLAATSTCVTRLNGDRYKSSIIYLSPFSAIFPVILIFFRVCFEC